MRRTSWTISSDTGGRPGLFPSWTLLAAAARIPLGGDQLSVPAQDRIGSDDRRDFQQSLAPQDLALDGQAAALIVVEYYADFAIMRSNANDAERRAA
jgi:hypothetical protein